MVNSVALGIITWWGWRLSIFFNLYFWRWRTRGRERGVTEPESYIPLVTELHLDTWLPAPKPAFLLDHSPEIASDITAQKTDQRHAEVWIQQMPLVFSIFSKQFNSFCIESRTICMPGAQVVWLFGTEQTSIFWKDEQLVIITWICLLLIDDECFQFISVTQSCLTLCDPMDCSTPGFCVFHQLLELAQTNVCSVEDAIQPSHPLSSPSPPSFNVSQHQDLFQWVRSMHQMTKVLVVASASVLPKNI